MYRLLINLLFFIALGVCDPKPDPNPPWRPGGSKNAGSEGWIDIEEGWGDTENDWGSMRGNKGGGSIKNWWGSNPSGRGSRSCRGAVRRLRCIYSVNEIEQNLVIAGQKMASFCIAHSDRSLREVYGVEHFKLQVRLTEFTEDNIQVRVHQRLVTILAWTCVAAYSAVRILPEVVDARHATWKMDDSTLTVLFPYTVTPDSDIQTRCGREFDPEPIIVPKCPSGTVFERDYDVRFNDANLRKAIRRYLEEMENEKDTEYVDR